MFATTGKLRLVAERNLEAEKIMGLELQISTPNLIYHQLLQIVTHAEIATHAWKQIPAKKKNVSGLKKELSLGRR